MRLAQISRKLNVKPSLVIKFINEELNDFSDLHPNSKLKEETVLAIKSHFLKQESEEINTVSESTIEETNVDENIDVIRVPKVEIEGVKIVGKIDLPEPKLKSEEVEEEKKETDEQSQRKKPFQRKRRRNSKKEEVLSYQDKLKKEKEQYEEELRLKQEKAKKKKKEYYKSKMKQQSKEQLQKGKKSGGSKISGGAKTQEPSVQKEPPKGLWGKFIHWLNN